MAMWLEHPLADLYLRGTWLETIWQQLCHVQSDGKFQYVYYIREMFSICNPLTANDSCTLKYN
jgi:hypothetical protein